MRIKKWKLGCTNLWGEGGFTLFGTFRDTRFGIYEICILNFVIYLEKVEK